VNLTIAEVPRELVAPLRVLVKAAHLFRGVVVEMATRPLEEIFQERGEALRVAEEALDLWIDRVGLAPVTAEGSAVADAAGSNGRSKEATRASVEENGRSNGTGKQLRTGGERGTVKRR
jgi:hypothetical protein